MLVRTKSALRKSLELLGYEVKRRSTQNVFEPEITQIIAKVADLTMTSNERIAALCDAVSYVVKAGLPGDFVECGVWRGGSSMAAALKLIQAGDTERRLYLYDTYEGMSPPTELDIEAKTKITAQSLLEKASKKDAVWAYATLDDVQENMRKTQYPEDRIIYVNGKVENTIPNMIPDKISILRLDTDWYESTKHELEYLFPRLVNGGVLLLDDYGHWEGARKAVDEYFADKPPVLLSRIDYTGRMGVKVPSPDSS